MTPEALKISFIENMVKVAEFSGLSAIVIIPSADKEDIVIQQTFDLSDVDVFNVLSFSTVALQKVIKDSPEEVTTKQ
jgi:hypothetical protein